MAKIVVIGTGTMAAGIGAGFINAGLDVVFLGRSADKACKSLGDAHKIAAGFKAGEASLQLPGSTGLIIRLPLFLSGRSKSATAWLHGPDRQLERLARCGVGDRTRSRRF
jgi:pyrroline-5-carboxylate reductase